MRRASAPAIDAGTAETHGLGTRERGRRVSGEAPPTLANSPHTLRQAEAQRYNSKMTNQLKEAIRLARTLPVEVQDRVAQILVAFAHGLDEQEPATE